MLWRASTCSPNAASAQKPRLCPGVSFCHAGKRNSAKSSCLPCRHFSICHPEALLPESFGQRGPLALPAQSVSSKLLELLLGASSWGQHRGRRLCRPSSLPRRKRELRFNRKKRLQQKSQLICHPPKENKYGNSSQTRLPAVVSCPLKRRISSMALYRSPFSSQNLRVHPAYSQAPTAPGSEQAGRENDLADQFSLLNQPWDSTVMVNTCVSPFPLIISLGHRQAAQRTA